MIELNLLPEELRIKERKKGEIPWKTIGISVAVGFVLLTLWLYVGYWQQARRLSELQARWIGIQEQYKELTELQTLVDGALKKEKDFMVSFVTSEKPLTHLMNWCSEFLPEGAWLTALNLKREGDVATIAIKGLAIPSKAFSSIEQIEDYLQKMKEKMPKSQLSLTTTRQVKEGVEITQFTANFTWGK